MGQIFRKPAIEANEDEFERTLPTDKSDLNLMKPYILELCKIYLSGVWERVQLEDFKIYKPCGGLSNYLFKCEIINPELKSIRNEPTNIFVRIYGEHVKKSINSMVKDILITSVLSDFNIGPKLYGVFSSGRLEELIQLKKASPLETSDMFKPEISKQVAELLAEFHSLDMPFVKRPDTIFETAEKNMKQVRRIKFISDKDSSNFEKLMEMNIWNEFCNLWKAMKALDTLIVFCHNDCNPGNILKLEKNKLMLIDYEYGSYNYRGFDIANSFCEMIFDYNCEEAPFFHAVPELFPNQEMQESFAEAYIERFKEINPAMIVKDPSLASKEKLLEEINHFVLVSHLFWVIWSLRMLPEASTFSFDHLEYGLLRAKLYFKQKKLLFPDGFDNFKE